MKTAFLGGSYTSRSPILASQTAVNIYAEKVEVQGSGVGGYYGTPGLESVFQGSGEVRGLWVSPTGVPGTYYLFAVIGNTVYRLDNDYGATFLGTLPNYSGRVSMIDNGIQLAIAHQNGFAYVPLTGTAIASVVGAPDGSILAALDNYVVFTENMGGEFGITALGDVSSVDPLDVATAEGWPDDCISVLADHREVWLFGTETIEIWSDTGAAFFPFERSPGGFIEQGCIAKWSPAKLDNSVFWLGRDREGQGIVYRANAYIPQRISTFALEYALAQASTIEDAIGFAYQEEGHTFYFLTFPTLGQTWVYDVASQLWHQRQYMDSDGTKGRHRANCYAFFNGDHLVGDYANGKIYRQSLNLTTDDGQPIYRERAWEQEVDDHKKARVDWLELLVQTGDGTTVTSGVATVDSTITMDSDITMDAVDSGSVSAAPIVWLQISKDAGRTWGYERQRTLGKIGQYKTRAKWRRCGSGRDIAFRVATTMTGRVVWKGANIQGAVYST